MPMKVWYHNWGGNTIPIVPTQNKGMTVLIPHIGLETYKTQEEKNDDC
jgi:hypothetical protein